MLTASRCSGRVESERKTVDSASESDLPRDFETVAPDISAADVGAGESPKDSNSFRLDTSGRAPCLRSWRDPPKPTIHGADGATQRGRPRRTAQEAAWSAPDAWPAWMTTTASASVMRMRFRAGKADRNACFGLAPNGQSIAPALPATRSNSGACSAGNTCSCPVAATTQVRPPAWRAPRCAAASMPRAPPDATTAPAFASIAARRSVNRVAPRFARREPTIATTTFASSDPPRVARQLGA